MSTFWHRSATVCRGFKSSTVATSPAPRSKSKRAQRFWLLAKATARFVASSVRPEPPLAATTVMIFPREDRPCPTVERRHNAAASSPCRSPDSSMKSSCAGTGAQHRIKFESRGPTAMIGTSTASRSRATMAVACSWSAGSTTTTASGAAALGNRVDGDDVAERAVVARSFERLPQAGRLDRTIRREQDHHEAACLPRARGGSR